MVTWRLIRHQAHNAYANMAIDEAILRARIMNLVPNTLRLYRWKPSAVSIGKFQKIENEVQIENCRKDGVDIVRRITGGGTVYHDAGDEITYSVIVSKKDLKTEDVSDIYARIYAGLSEAVRALGAHSDFQEGSRRMCPNLTICGRKISGSAQCHRGGVVLQHGTVLMRVDLHKMYRYLRVQWIPSTLEAVKIARTKITSLEAELGRGISGEEIQEVLIRGFEKTLEAHLEIAELTSREAHAAEELVEAKYATDDWNFRVLSRSEETSCQL